MLQRGRVQEMQSMFCGESVTHVPHSAARIGRSWPSARTNMRSTGLPAFESVTLCSNCHASCMLAHSHVHQATSM